MKDLIDWLMRIEHISGKLYGDAALFFSDKRIKEFLQRCAEDEALHLGIMASAAQAIQAQADINSAFVVDQEIKKAIEWPFKENRARLSAGSLTEAQVIDCVVETEFSEWNDIFLYVVNSMKDIKPRFKSAAAKIQNHLWQVEQFLSTTEYGRQKTEIIRNLQPVWKEKILIVEDDPAISELLVAILDGEGSVDTAANGEIGLQKIRKKYYQLIVSDIDMPVMDGRSMFHEAVSEFKDIGRRFLFLTGHPAGPIVDFFEANDLKYLTKPASINAIKQHALAAMHNIQDN